MKGEGLSYHTSTKMKPNDHPLTNYSHLNYPTPQMHIGIKKICIFLVVFKLTPTKWKISSVKLAQLESIDPELSFDTKIVWLGLLFVLKFCQETSMNQP